MIEKLFQYNRPPIFLFVNFGKAFDTKGFNGIIRELKKSRLEYKKANQYLPLLKKT